MKKLLCILGVMSLAGCSGITHNDEVYTAHAESFNIVGLQIPGNTQDRAMDLVPEGATVETIRATDSDTDSALGIINRIIGIDYVQVGGKKQ
ncbi:MULTISPECIES: hypothetical protein [Vibrio]|uniref:Uncharacterized protein n=2 Tax=Vibrio genomosp. F10 TaxID=723171 RepID=A0A1B9QXQ8_9VIBR|nr:MULTISPECIES: hypothetical protein [Vibrio]OCH74764.1 hypothetical protein A6E14_12125 [Vibrio genomosp. F10]OEE31910.1 hypothetical protein A1QO_12275 [Vibrio genomosp. F10 str. ZF-129]OEE94141.1 hypothetical protein A1QM_01210 [Vibrio genomosp. F10 str. 9ZC157]OEE96449.1 hypothetical protein A1QK_14085 [Vibrio genomosp. F10 str. 9ZD137]OEF04980.1 hypothetical protein A1QI_09580 [Vibrio genomosp. F10 str. 9ZB36]